MNKGGLSETERPTYRGSVPEGSCLYLAGQRAEAPKRCFYDFKGKKLTGGILDELNHQFMRRLQKEGLITMKKLCIDGTKTEANANRHTFVWRGSINYQLAGLLDKAFYVEEDLLQQADVRSRNKFLNQALKFYIGYLTSEKIENYMLSTISSV